MQVDPPGPPPPPLQKPEQHDAFAHESPGIAQPVGVTQVPLEQVKPAQQGCETEHEANAPEHAAPASTDDWMSWMSITSRGTSIGETMSTPTSMPVSIATSNRGVVSKPVSTAGGTSMVSAVGMMTSRPASTGLAPSDASTELSRGPASALPSVASRVSACASC
jgi:hypothetical protein